MYVEKCYGLHDRGNIVPMTEITNESCSTECHYTLFPFDASIVRHVEVNKTIKNHKGKHYCPYILIDVDCDNDLEGARQSVLRLITRLNQDFEIDPDMLHVYFSGKKGFHVVIPGELYTPLKPSVNMGKKIKNVIAKLTEGIEHVDMSIYENHRIIRAPNSKHKEGNYKIELTFEELTNWTVIKIIACAQEPRLISPIYLNTDLKINKKFDAFVARNFFAETVQKKSSGEHVNFFAPPEVGDRNNQLFKQAALLFSESNLKEESVFQIIQNCNQLCSQQLMATEVERIIKSAAASREHHVSDDVLQYVGMISDFIPGMVDSYKDEKEKISLCFGSLDKVFEGNLRQKLGVILGYGGTKKSMLGQCITYANVAIGRRVIYANMEMGAVELTKRFFDIYKKGENDIASNEIKGQANKDPREVEKKLKESFGNYFGNNLVICNKSSSTCEDFRNLLDQVAGMLGKTDLLIVDGLSMMGGKGNEMERANVNTLGLMDIAKDYNLLTLAIVHASKGEKLTTRDLRHKARASEKIIDNCSFVITMSMLSDKEDRAVKKYGVYHLDNKRGAGENFSKAFELMQNRLLMRELSISIKELEKKSRLASDIKK